MKNPIGKRLIVFFAIWHVSLSIPILISLSLPWVDNTNYFEYAFVECAGCAVGASLFLFFTFGFVLGLSGFFSISAFFCKDLDLARRKLEIAIGVFIPIPLTFLLGGFSLFDSLWGPSFINGIGSHLFLTLWGIYSIFALIELIFGITAYVLGYFPKELKSKEIDPFDQMF